MDYHDKLFVKEIEARGCLQAYESISSRNVTEKTAVHTTYLSLSSEADESVIMATGFERPGCRPSQVPPCDWPTDPIRDRLNASDIICRDLILLFDETLDYNISIRNADTDNIIIQYDDPVTEVHNANEFSVFKYPMEDGTCIDLPSGYYKFHMKYRIEGKSNNMYDYYFFID
jgi:hypothetical protein